MASPGGWVLLLLGASACNSLLGIHEASLDCDAPACASGVPSSGAPSGMDGPAADGIERVDGGTAPDGAGGRSNAAGAAGAPSGSGASSEAGPVPIAPPEGVGGGSTNGAPAASSGGTAGGADTQPPGAGGATSGAGAGGAPGPCNSGDACGDCLCESCDEPLAACTGTPGCLEILACARNSGCVGFACYCGSVDLITCAISDLADGPCIATMLAAPGSHPPTVSDPNAGPASQAALVVAECRGQRCAAPCGP